MMAGHTIVEIPSSNVKKRITEILYDQGYILKYKFEDFAPQGVIKIALKYQKDSKDPVIRKMGRISRPGQETLHHKMSRWQQLSGRNNYYLYRRNSTLSWTSERG